MELPRHLQSTSSGPSSHASSPSGTPPGSQPRSPAAPATVALPSPSLGPVPLPGSPSAPTQNRFGSALNFIHRRPRGQSLSANAPSTSPGSAPPISPTGENSPSPGGEREARGGYGFPALRRQLSKRPSTSGGSASPAPDAARTRTHRSSSQPPAANASGSTAPQSTPLLDAVPPSFSTPTPTNSSIPLPTPTSPDPSTSTTPSTTHRLRLVPHLESARSLHFDPVDRDLTSLVVLRVGRFTDRSHHPSHSVDPLRIAFKSKVVSRGHAEIWCDEGGKFFIRDTKSSSGTFLNHIRLSGPGAESRPFPLKDGDVLQLGVDYQGGTEEIYRCVKMKIELNRGWQRGMNSFNTNALAQLRALGGGMMADPAVAAPTTASTATAVTAKQHAAKAAATSVTDCCICLYPVTVCQALFIAPCSHVTHYKCIRPLILQNYPGFSCPLCRTYADLEADVEIDDPWEPVQPETVEEEPEEESTDVLPSDDDPIPAPLLPIDSNRSRPASIALTGADGTSIPFPITSHLRPSSLDTSDEPSSNPILIPLSTPESQAALYASLADAATPPNSTFLSTLADSDHCYARYALPVVSLDQVFDRFASGSSERGEVGPGPSVVGVLAGGVARGNFGSEEETDGAREEEEGGEGVEGGERRKGKGREEVVELGRRGEVEEVVVV